MIRVQERRFVSLAILSTLLALPGCRGSGPGEDSSLGLEIGISPTPPAVGPARLIITLQDTLGNPMDGARVEVEGNMSHAGMAPVFETARAQGNGLYVVPAFRFTMAGDWVLTVRATLPGGESTEIQKAVGVVGAHPGASGGSEPEPGEPPESAPTPGLPAPLSEDTGGLS